jgi:hypothetical protein
MSEIQITTNGSEAMSEIQDLTDWPDSSRGCFWHVRDPLAGYRQCGNGGTRHYGPEMAFCSPHERRFLASVLAEIEENPPFRDRLIRRVSILEREEPALWAEHKKEIRDWPVNASRAHCVYFTERDGFVKIGRTSNIGKRMHDIGKGSCNPQGMSVGPVRLLALIYCGCTGRSCVRERFFHGKFRHLWLEGEWFLFDEELAAFIGGLDDCLDGRLREVSREDRKAAFGHAIDAHRERCTRCTRGTGCSTYLRIVREYIEAPLSPLAARAGESGMSA